MLSNLGFSKRQSLLEIGTAYSSDYLFPRLSFAPTSLKTVHVNVCCTLQCINWKMEVAVAAFSCRVSTRRSFSRRTTIGRKHMNEKLYTTVLLFPLEVITMVPVLAMRIFQQLQLRDLGKWAAIKAPLSSEYCIFLGIGRNHKLVFITASLSVLKGGTQVPLPIICRYEFQQDIPLLHLLVCCPCIQSSKTHLYFICLCVAHAFKVA